MEELAQAAALYRAGTYRDAALALDNILSEHPEHPGALSIQGLCHIRLGETNAGLEALARAANLAPRDGAILLHFGLGLMAAKQTALAVTLFKQAALLLPFDPAPLLNLASGLLLLGDREGARGAARKAKSRAPHMAEAHYTLGLIDAASDNLPAAAQSFARATALAPDFAEAWLNLGVTRYRQHNMRGARAAMERALAVRPGYAAAETNLAVFDRLDGYPERAQKRLDAVFAADPHNDDARIAQLLALQGQDRVELAMALLEGPPPSDPAAALHWRLQHALVLINLNRTQEARAMLESLGPIPPAFASLLEFRLALLALDEGEPVRALAHIETMERQLRGTHGMLPEHRLVGWYDLARFWQRQDEPGRAFDAQVEGHRVLGRLQPFSRENYTAFMEATMAAFDSGTCAQVTRLAALTRTPRKQLALPAFPVRRRRSASAPIARRRSGRCATANRSARSTCRQFDPRSARPVSHRARRLWAGG